MRFLKVLVLFLLIFILGSSNVEASTYYVSNSGNDTNNGTSISTPLKTITKAVSKVVAGGDTILIEPGTYSEKVKITGKNGTALFPIRIIGNSKDQSSYPILDGGNANYASSTDNPVFTFSNSSWFTIERLKFQNSGLSSIF